MPSANSRDERRLDDVRFDILSQLGVQIVSRRTAVRWLPPAF
jgi:hypothetical protein